MVYAYRHGYMRVRARVHLVAVAVCSGSGADIYALEYAPSTVKVNRARLVGKAPSSQADDHTRLPDAIVPIGHACRPACSRAKEYRSQHRQFRAAGFHGSFIWGAGRLWLHHVPS